MAGNAKDSAEYHDDKDQADALKKGNVVHCGEVFAMFSFVILLMALGVCMFVISL